MGDGVCFRPAGVGESRVHSPHGTEPHKGLRLPPSPALAPAAPKAETLTWFESHLQPNGRCRSAGLSWSSQWWYQESGRQKAGGWHQCSIWALSTHFLPRGERKAKEYACLCASTARRPKPRPPQAAHHPALWEALEWVQARELEQEKLLRGRLSQGETGRAGREAWGKSLHDLHPGKL